MIDKARYANLLPVNAMGGSQRTALLTNKHLPVEPDRELKQASQDDVRDADTPSPTFRNRSKVDDDSFYVGDTT